MGNLLLNYLEKRDAAREALKNESNLGGPLITISREAGCNAVELADLIATRFNTKNPKSKWKVISKEIYQETAEELQMDPKEVFKVLHKSEKYAFDKVLKAFSDKHYVSEAKIEKTIKEVILHNAMDGHCIMVGRAVNIIAKDIKKALHIRLVAPLEYRVSSIMQSNHLSEEEATEYIDRIDKERKAYRKTLLKDNPNYKLYNITFDRSVFTDEEIVDILEFSAIKKGLFNRNPD
ncbi:MAG TPA: cytidylate kinase-like family protein [Bacteroidia bacterium]|nr:cytidylate kinase-like family protein [Bacteroidia bacterium]